MPSDVIIKMKCPGFLIQFLEKLYGEMPIVFPRNADLLRTLNHLLSRPPKSHQPDSNYEGMLLIRLPYFEDKNILYNFYLSEYSQKLFIQRLERYFKLVFRDDINKSRLSELDCKKSINLFMDKFDFNGDDIYEYLLKDYNRYFQLKYSMRYYKKTLKKKTSVQVIKM